MMVILFPSDATKMDTRDDITGGSGGERANHEQLHVAHTTWMYKETILQAIREEIEVVEWELWNDLEVEKTGGGDYDFGELDLRPEVH